MVITVPAQHLLKEKFCGFEQADHGEMGECGSPAVARAGRKYLCKEHTEYVFGIYHEIKHEHSYIAHPKEAKSIIEGLVPWQSGNEERKDNER